MKKISVIMIILLLSGCAQIKYRVIGPSRIEKYCSRIAGTTDKNNRLMQRCIKQEEEAKAGIARLVIPAEIAESCRRISERTGGSYHVMLTCVKKEMSEQ